MHAGMLPCALTTTCALCHGAVRVPPLQGRPVLCAVETGAVQAGELGKETPSGLGRYGCCCVTVRNATVVKALTCALDPPHCN